jgi:hypothetical protein
MIKPGPGRETGNDEKLGSYIVIRDSFSALDKHLYTISHHLAPGCRATARGNRVYAADSAGRGLNISLFAAQKLSSKVVDSSVSRGYLRSEPSLTAIFEARVRGNAALTTFIIPSERGKDVGVVQKGNGRDSYSGFYIATEDSLDILLFSGNDGQGTEITAPGVTLWSRFAGRRLVRAALIRKNSAFAGASSAAESNRNEEEIVELFAAAGQVSAAAADVLFDGRAASGRDPGRSTALDSVWSSY